MRLIDLMILRQEINRQINEELREVRKSIDETQANLAKLMDASRCTVVRYEAGHSIVPDNYIKKLVKSVKEIYKL